MASWDGAVVLPTLLSLAVQTSDRRGPGRGSNGWCCVWGLDASLSLSSVLLSPGLKWGPQLALSQLYWGVPSPEPPRIPTSINGIHRSPTVPQGLPS